MSHTPTSVPHHVTAEQNDTHPSNEEPVKKRRLSLERAMESNTSTASLSKLFNKRPRSGSIDSQSSSSWIQRLYPSRTQQRVASHDDATSKNEPKAPENSSGMGDNGGNGNDDGNKKDEAMPQGFWSWFGYASNTTTASVDKKMQETTSIDSKANDRSYWRSLFWSSEPNGGDSVIIDPSNNDESNNVPRPTQPAKKNVVLPALHSPVSTPLSSPTTATATATTSLLSRALNAINAMFVQAKTESSSSSSRFVASMAKDPGSKKFVIVGVHGWFPMKLVRSMIGEPTGTSTKFCEQMMLGVKQYFRDTHRITIPDRALTCIPLEGEGKVQERVNKLYHSLVNNPVWLDALASADVVFWATHSQGTPVSVMLLHRLLEEGRIHSSQPICLLAMAGIAHGPFPWLKGSLIVKYFEADAARELFDFMDSSSEISQKFRHSLKFLLQSGRVRTVLVGSMQDQVVPLYSAIMTSATHPSILRAVYIDGHVYSEDDFLINLITFALRLRNAGFSDHGLLTHISEVLAGNLYAWEGAHSTIYEELEVYMIAVQCLFETEPATTWRTSSSRKSLDLKEEQVMLDPFHAKVRQNPFYLPWAMRGICDDARVLGDEIFSRELEKLRALFDRWTPASAKLREIKFRLEPLKARL